MRRQRAVSLFIGAACLCTLSLGVNRALPANPAVAHPSAIGSTGNVASSYAPFEVSREERGPHRPILQLHRVPTETVRTPRPRPVRPSRHIRPRVIHVSGAEAWAASEHVRRLIQCESGGDPTVVSVHAGVTYYGLYQMNRDFWITYGGDPSYLHRPFRAPVWMQNEVAYRGYLHRGYEPWTCG